MPALEFCTCLVRDCQHHPSRHEGDCAPCVKKNLDCHEIPACFWYKIGQKAEVESEYVFHKFARKVLEAEGRET